MTLLFLVAALFTCLSPVSAAASTSQLRRGLDQVKGGNRRTFITVEYEYQLEVNAGNSSASPNFFHDVLSDIDSRMVGHLQATIPNGQPQDGMAMPNVKYNRINSHKSSQCFTDSDACHWIKSKIGLSYAREKPKDSVQHVTLRMVRDFLEEYSETSNNLVQAMYAYPMIVSSRARFDLSPVMGEMSSDEIAALEQSYLDVFGAIILAFDGDTEVTDAGYVYQALHTLNSETDLSSLSVDLTVIGKCRICSDEEFADTVSGVVQENLLAFQNKLKKNGNLVNSTYFDVLENVSFSIPEMPEGLPPIQDISIFSSEAPETRRSLPWYLFCGIGIAIVVVGAGIYLLYRHRKKLEERRHNENEKDDDDFSTGSSESDERDDDSESEYEISDHEEETIDVFADGDDNDDAYDDDKYSKGEADGESFVSQDPPAATLTSTGL